MTLKRFLFILRMLHLNDNTKMPERSSLNFDKLFKVRPILNHFNAVFRQVFSPSRFLSIDESMIACKGRSSFKQYLPLKPIKRGFKIWGIFCSVTGYMIGYDFYAGKTATREGPLGESVVLGLVRGYENLGYCIFFDRFFSSFSLVKKLLLKGCFNCSTILQTKKFFPKDLFKNDKNLTLGEYDYVSTRDMGLVKWKDRGTKSVCIVSSMDDPSETCSISRKNIHGQKYQLLCPVAVALYNKYMGGVDLFDQLTSYYNIQWKSRCWWVKVFYYLIDAAVVNSYILYKLEMNKLQKKTVTHLMFRSQLADQLIGEFCSRVTKKKNVVITKKKFNLSPIVTVPNTEGHLPIKGTSRCANCSTRNKPVQSNLVCKMCDVALCKVPCFQQFHENMGKATASKLN
ncbi:piggyBac transposable element-derived protein 4-like isoform X1 [Bacillus rossius redtenbacheri]|uniref:piggyBac transposable element-derived protein 4-like isoform X1 n=1 Tax=Bacillus rossius redtenbacheri TaxID=93214 RepID=UPI002FDDC43E